MAVAELEPKTLGSFLNVAIAEKSEMQSVQSAPNIIVYTSSPDRKAPDPLEIFAMNMGKIYSLADQENTKNSLEPYHDWVNQADRITRYVAQTIFPDHPEILASLDRATALLHDPVETRRRILEDTPSTTDEITIDTQRNLIELVGQTALRMKEGDLFKEQEEAVHMLKQNLFVGGVEVTRNVITLQDRETGKVKSIEILPEDESPLSRILGNNNREEIVRVARRRMGYVKGVGWVEISPRPNGRKTLERIVVKLLEKAVDGKSDTLNPYSVKDIYGTMSVVVGLMGDSRTSPQITTLRQLQASAMEEHFRLRDMYVEPDDALDGYSSQSGKFVMQRDQYKLTDRPLSNNSHTSEEQLHAGLEAMIHTDSDFQENLLETERSEEKNDARTHLGMEILRAGKAAKILLRHFGIDTEQATQARYEATLQRIPTQQGPIYQEALSVVPRTMEFTHTSYDLDENGQSTKGFYIPARNGHAEIRSTSKPDYAKSASEKLQLLRMELEQLKAQQEREKQLVEV